MAYKDTLTITDNRSGQTIEVPITYGTHPMHSASIPSMALRSFKQSDEDFGLLGYDPSYQNTASTKSAITFIDGETGILRYRGYPIEQVAEGADYLESAYLILYGELPTSSQYDEWADDIRSEAPLHENIKTLLSGFRPDAHPMGIFSCIVGALSTFYPESKDVADPANRERQIRRLIAKVAPIAAYSYRSMMDLPYVEPDGGLSYAGNFLNMLFQSSDKGVSYEPDPVIERALDVIFTLHADHEQNCSTTTMRVAGSSLPDPYVSVAGASAALYGPLHGGANEHVLKMLHEIESSGSGVAPYIDKAKKGEFRLMGFGHRVYKSFDPRARIIKKMADDVFKVTGTNPLLDIALEIERIALEDDYFVERKLYPNVDFYSGLILDAIGIPSNFFTVLFAISRTVGWLAHWEEMLEDSEQKIARPRQIYTGEDQRAFVPIDKR
jgi:citrate synthase